METVFLWIKYIAKEMSAMSYLLTSVKISKLQPILQLCNFKEFSNKYIKYR